MPLAKSEQWDRKAHLNKKDLKGRGWTDAAFKLFLPNSDHSGVNPMYVSGPPIHYWLVKRIEKIERTRKFIAWREAGKGRKAGAAAAVNTKTQATMEYVSSVIITVPILPQDELFSRAIRSARGNPEPNRGAVNYLRHELTCYEYELYRIAGRVGIAEARAKLRGKVYAAIAKAYPALEDECERQARKRDADGEFIDALWELEDADDEGESEEDNPATAAQIETPAA